MINVYLPPTGYTIQLYIFLSKAARDKILCGSKKFVSHVVGLVVQSQSSLMFVSGSEFLKEKLLADQYAAMEDS